MDPKLIEELRQKYIKNPPEGMAAKGDGRIAWPITEEERKQHGSAYPYFFQKGAIYRLRVCDLLDSTVPEGRLPSFYNRFLVTEVLEENVRNNALAAVLEAYRTPVVLEDKALGNFTLDKDYSHFEGSITWVEKQISVYMESGPQDANMEG